MSRHPDRIGREADREADALVWKWFDCDYKAHCPTRELYDKMIRWKGARPGGVNDMPDGSRAYDVIISEYLAERARSLLREHFRVETEKSATNRPLNNNDLQQPELRQEGIR